LLGVAVGVVVDDDRDGDRDPVLARAFSLSGLAGALPAAVLALDRFVAVVVDGADVRLVAQHPVDR
jgi:hypothetical protein